ncbi:MAG: adenine-specific methyltransferase EcoRI family protein [Lachnospiraceae bacterium]|nr:adenine-specific methyltransferase EcoRI family protein [Lachnospiraceae bacterium]
MANNKEVLGAAKAAKKNEFYTQLTDIEKEVRHYKKHFKDKVVLCNCDDPFESNFFRYFVLNFNKLGLKKLIATCYSTSPIRGKQFDYTVDIDGQISFFMESNQTTSLLCGEANESNKKPYKATVTTVYDKSGDGGLDMDDIAKLFESGENKLEELSGDGDFRSDECIGILKEADIIVTNPPFALFREYINTLIKFDKKFLIIGNQNAISYKEVFPYLMNNEVWLGYGFAGNVGFFISPYEDTAVSSQHKEGLIRVSGVMWFTNLDIKKRHEDFIPTRFYKGHEQDYEKYDNYDAIEVSKTEEIPGDYEGVMGVPITFLAKHNPEQFEIVGCTQSWFDNRIKIYPKQIQVDKTGKQSSVTKLNDGPAIKVSEAPSDKTYYIVDEAFFIKKFARILIKNKRPEKPLEVNI